MSTFNGIRDFVSLNSAGKSGKIPYGQLKKYYRDENGDGVTHVMDTTKATANAIEKFRYFYHPDHLGSSSYITDASGEVYQHFEYFPFGETFYEARADHQRTPYLYNGKELDKETGLYYYGARYYDPRISMFYGVDRFANKSPWQSPYGYAGNNPVGNIDINGDSTFVSANLNGTYKVKDGTFDNDNGIYLKNGGNTSLIGYSATPESFYNSDEKKWMGTIDPSDQSGRNFLNSQIVGDNPGLIKYMSNAKGSEPLDFKRTNGTDNVLFDTPEGWYRGMPLSLEGENASLPVYGSARDVGNMGAGIVAGRAGLSWGVARFGFDFLQTKQDFGKAKAILFYPFFGVQSIEGSSTQYGERLGFRIGSQIRQAATANSLRRLPSYGGLKVPSVSNSILKRSDYTPWK